MKHLLLLFSMILALHQAAWPVAFSQGAGCNNSAATAQPRMTVTPMTVDFGTLQLGSIKDEFVIVENISTFVITLGRGVIENDAARVFSVVGTGANLAPGERYQFRVRCALNQLGQLEGWLVFSSNDTTFKPKVYVHLIVNAVYSEVGAVEPASSELLAPFPNPASGNITLRIWNGEQDRAVLSVFDAQGRECAVPFDGELSPGEHVYPLDASALPAGAYRCVLRTRERSVTRPFLIIR